MLMVEWYIAIIYTEKDIENDPYRQKINAPLWQIHCPGPLCYIVKNL